MTPVIALLGPTASGKSALASAVARRRGDIEIVSADSMQVYRGMDIGTAKPTAADRAEVPYHLLDLVDPDDDFTVARYQRAFAPVIAGIVDRGRVPLVVGGTGLYLRAALDGLDIPGRYPSVRAELETQPDTALLHRRLTEADPVAAARMEPTNRRRIVRALEVTLGSGRPFSSYGPGLESYPDDGHLRLGLRLPRTTIDARIEQRYGEQLAAGFVDEVRTLLSRPGGLGATAAQALGYRELTDHLVAGRPMAACVEEAVRRTRRFARRQERWFRRDPRIRWLDGGDNPLALVDEVLRHCEAFVDRREVCT